jgi:hypothetical protein
MDRWHFGQAIALYDRFGRDRTSVEVQNGHLIRMVLSERTFCRAG